MRATRRRFLAGCLGAAALGAAGCGGPGGGPAPRDAGAPTSGSRTAGAVAEYWPPASGPWERVEPAAAGWDVGALEAAVALAGERATGSLRVLLDGRVLVAREWGVPPDFARDVASCQKSLVGLLVLVARDRDLLALDDAVTTHLGSGWSGTSPDREGGITVRHLLTMTSGLDDRLRWAAPPGTTWRYNTTAYHRLQPVLERATATELAALSREWVTAPIGAVRSTWYRRPGPDPTGRPVLGLTMTTDDMARLGLLVLRGGAWDGAPVIAAPTLEEALAPSQELNPAYGHLWWRNGAAAPYRIPGAPEDLVAALGNEDQKIYVSRSAGLVVSRLGERGGSGPPSSPDSFDSAFLGALMAAAPR